MLNWFLLYALPTSFALCFLSHGRPSREPLNGFLKFRVRVVVLLLLLGVGVFRGDPWVPGDTYGLWWASHTVSFLWVAVVPPTTALFWVLKTVTFQVGFNPSQYANGAKVPPRIRMEVPCLWNVAFWAWFLGPWLPFGRCWGQRFLRGLVSNW